MSIVAACPHCESRFHLQPDLIGKAMRCPNPDCREPFVVEEAKGKSKKPGNPPQPTHTSGSVGEVVPIVEAEVVPPRQKPPKPRSPKPASTPPPDLPPIFDQPEEEPIVEPEALAPPQNVVEAKIVEAKVVAPAPAREVVWTPDAEAPVPAPSKPKAVRAEPAFEEVHEEEEEEIFVRKRKKKNYAPMILIGLVVVTVLVGGGIAAYVLRVQTVSEEQEAADAADKYAKAEYGPSEKAHNELAAKYPGSKNAEKYRFFADLSGARLSVSSVTSADNPRIAIDKLRGFIDAHKSSPLAKPDAYGHDVFDAGKKVLEDVEKNVKEHLTAFKSDRKAKFDDLKKAEEMLAVGHEFIPVLKDFRSKEDLSLEELRGRLDEKVKPSIASERKRLDVLASVRKLVEIPTDQAIQDAKTYLASNDLSADEDALELVRTAEANFLKAIRWEREPGNPQAPPAPAAASLLFVAPIGPTRPSVRGPDEHPTVFLAIARGVLYALDEDTGDLLWAARVGPDVSDPPTIAQVQLPEGPTDLALVTSNVAGQPAITAYVLRTGQAKWSQPLTPKLGDGMDPAKLPPAPAAGAAAAIGSRAYVPIRDAAGSVLAFDITTGQKIGRITVGQAIGPGAIVRPGTSHLYIAAESRRVFVFDVEGVAAGGDAQCLRVIPTDHPTGTLRTLPTILGLPGDDPSPRFFVLAQADGAGMKLRAFPLPQTPILAADAPPLLEPIGTPVELALNGWAWFPPVSDSERLTVVTDRNQFKIFGINQPGNRDAALFPLPVPPPEPQKNEAIRGLVVPAEEGAYWVLMGGSLRKYRLTLKPDLGLTLVSDDVGLPIGEPTQPAQLNPRRDTACFVVRSANSSGFRAVAVRLQDGEPRWQRQLGITPSTAPTRTSAGVLMVDGDGGAVAIPAAGLTASKDAVKAAPEWTAAAPIDGVTQPTQTAVSADGTIAFTIAPTGEGAIAKWVIRRAVDGKFNHAGSVKAPAALAGLPVVANGTLLIPAADGFIHRLVIGDGRGIADTLTAGPKWLLNRNVENPECFIVSLTNETFLTSDGGKIMKRWNWPVGAGWVDDNASWTFRERIGSAPLAMPAASGKPARMLVADATGGIWLYALDRTDTPIRRWKPGVTVALPAGKVSPKFGVQVDSAGRQLAIYTVNDKVIVCLDVDSDEPRWVVATKGDAASSIVGTPSPAGDGRWLATDLGGRVAILNAESGLPLLTREVGLPGAVPATAGVPLGENRVLVPLSDGSAALVDLTPESKAKE